MTIRVEPNDLNRNAMRIDAVSDQIKDIAKEIYSAASTNSSGYWEFDSKVRQIARNMQNKGNDKSTKLSENSENLFKRAKLFADTDGQQMFSCSYLSSLVDPKYLDFNIEDISAIEQNVGKTWLDKLRKELDLLINAGMLKLEDAATEFEKRKAKLLKGIREKIEGITNWFNEMERKGYKYGLEALSSLKETLDDVKDIGTGGLMTLAIYGMYKNVYTNGSLTKIGFTTAETFRELLGLKVPVGARPNILLQYGNKKALELMGLAEEQPSGIKKWVMDKLGIIKKTKPNVYDPSPVKMTVTKNIVNAVRNVSDGVMKIQIIDGAIEGVKKAYDTFKKEKDRKTSERVAAAGVDGVVTASIQIAGAAAATKIAGFVAGKVALHVASSAVLGATLGAAAAPIAAAAVIVGGVYLLHNTLGKKVIYPWLQEKWEKSGGREFLVKVGGKINEGIATITKKAVDILPVTRTIKEVTKAVQNPREWVKEKREQVTKTVNNVIDATKKFTSLFTKKPAEQGA